MAVLLLVLLQITASTSGTDVLFYDHSQSEKEHQNFLNKTHSEDITGKRQISPNYQVALGSLTTVAQPVTNSFDPSFSLTTSTSQEPNFFHAANKSRSGHIVRSVGRFNGDFPTIPPYTTPSTQEVPSYVPHMRKFFTPPLPPEYSNPFADKPTLRGSYSDPGSSSSNRRPILPPPRYPPNRERIPLRPPDLVPVEKENPSPTDRKKPLNTPSFNRPPEAPFSDLSSTSPYSRHNNETEYDTVPGLHSPSISRILSGSNGRKLSNPTIIVNSNSEPKASQLPDVFRKMETESVDPSLGKKDTSQYVMKAGSDHSAYSKPVAPDLNEKQQDTLGGQDTLSSDADLNVDEHSDRHEEQLPDIQQQPPKSDDRVIHVAISPSTPAHKDLRGKWGVAWDVHVYLMGSLFTVLSICSGINIARVNASRRLLSYGYFIGLHALLLLIGILRGVYLFYDGYNVSKSFPEPVSLLMFHIVSPCITAAFLVLFLFLLTTTKVYMFSARFQNPIVVAVFITAHLVTCVSLDLASGFTSETFLSLICQCLFVVICVCLGLAYLYSYRALVRAATRKPDTSFGNNFTNINHPTLSIAIRLTLATALLILLLSAAHLYGVFGVDDNLDWESKSLPWLRWGHQFSIRVIEIAMCFLLLWAGVQPLRQERAEEEKDSQNSGFALFRCRQCTSTTQNSETTDDIYPAVCVTNQAIHDYTVRTGKKVYDDSFPLNNLHSGYALPESTFSVSTSERRLLRKSGYTSHDAPFPVSEVGTSERRSLKSAAFNAERADFDLPFATTTEVRRSLKNSGTLRHNIGRPELSFKCSASSDNRSLKASGMSDSSYCSGSSSSDVSRSVKKSGTLVSLNSERRSAVNKSGSQTLSSARERVSPSMLVAENGFVRFRALADSEELEPSEIVRR